MRRKLNNSKIRQSERYKVVSYTLLQTLTQSPHFISTRVSVRINSNACCIIHLRTIKPLDYIHTTTTEGCEC